MNIHKKKRFFKKTYKSTHNTHETRELYKNKETRSRFARWAMGTHGVGCGNKWVVGGRQKGVGS